MADHLTQECHKTGETYEDQCNVLGMYRKPYTLYTYTYNPCWRNHPNFSWKQESHQLSQTSQPRGYSTPQYPTHAVSRNLLDDTMQAFVEAKKATMEAQKAFVETQSKTK